MRARAEFIMKWMNSTRLVRLLLSVDCHSSFDPLCIFMPVVSGMFHGAGLYLVSDLFLVHPLPQ
jgi:hypothetical protein